MPKHLTILLICLAALGLNAQVLKTWNWSRPPVRDFTLRGKATIRSVQDTPHLTASEGYAFGALFFNAPSQPYRLVCRGMALPDSSPASVGAILYRREGTQWKNIANIGWKQTLPFEKHREIIFDINPDAPRTSRYMVILFRISGTVAIRDMRLEKRTPQKAVADASAPPQAPAIVPPQPRAYRYPAGSGDNQPLTYFPFGVFLYADVVPDMKTLGQAFAELHMAGVNTVRFAGCLEDNDNRPWVHIREAAKLAETYDLKLWCQMNDVYYRHDGHRILKRLKFRNGMEYIDRFVSPRLDNALPSYHNLPALYALETSEENRPSYTKPLAHYRELLWGHLPKVRVFELFNELKTLQSLQDPMPTIAGIDRYPFRYEGTTVDTRLWHPHFGLNWLGNTMKPFFNQAQKMNIPMVGVIQGLQEFGLIPTQDVAPGLDDPAKLAAFTLPEAPCLTYNPQHKRFQRWGLYFPARNGIRAQAWTAVCEGAKGILLWAYSPFSHHQQIAQGRDLIQQGKGKSFIVSLSSTHPNWEDMKQTIREIMPWGNLLLTLEKQQKKLLDLKEPDLRCNFFKDPRGRDYAIIVNLRLVDTEHQHPLIIDDNGTLVSPPTATNRTIPLPDGRQIIDLTTGKPVTAVTLEPGQGKLLLIND